MIRIDGGRGEGGGQILRTSLFFSLVMREEVEVFNIRAKRDNPGLRPQHLAVLRAFTEVTEGRSENATIGSDRITFTPSTAVKSSLEIDVGTAGSITLILQSLLPAISMRGLSCRIAVRGGTDTRWSPTFDYFKLVLEPAMEAVGIPFASRVYRRGYYPAGGGRVEAECHPARKGAYVQLVGGPGSEEARILSVCSKLPRSVATRQAESAASLLQEAGIRVAELTVDESQSESPGTSILVYHNETPSVFIGGDAVGERHLRAEEVGASAAKAFIPALAKRASVDHHLADMLVSVLALHGGGEMLTDESTEHLRTNLEVAKAFTGCSYEVSTDGALCRVKVLGR